MATADVMEFVEALIAAKIVSPGMSTPMIGLSRWARWTELLYMLWPRAERCDKTIGGRAEQRDAMGHEAERGQP